MIWQSLVSFPVCSLGCLLRTLCADGLTELAKHVSLHNRAMNKVYYKGGKRKRQSSCYAHGGLMLLILYSPPKTILLQMSFI